MAESDAHELEERFRTAQERFIRQDAFPCGYWIARHPVSVAQFGRFVADKGYQTRAWWVEAERAGVWKDGRITGWTWNEEIGQVREEIRSRPGDSGLHFGTPNHPVVGITWYEAMAYCRWIDHHFSSKGTFRLRLPSEAEWELAARGGERIPNSNQIGVLSGGLKVGQTQRFVKNPQPKRSFPWGDQPKTDHANTHELEFQGTSAAGCFGCGRSPYGVEDLSGNVWEWTRSLWGRAVRKPEFGYPYRAEDGREDELASKEVARVLRGGSWGFPADGARCAYRAGREPVYRSRYVGFRLVASPFDSGR
ncbi:MAG: SUMF1/EgtB/PvdO family nonheme iron enzyme [Verrucomicrobiales bacterium]|nr:SUMF1/EgtB/PvdO family nonheme iron enzyme [Verrucomicrobiales bacterium]